MRPHFALPGLILRDAAWWPLLRMRGKARYAGLSRDKYLSTHQAGTLVVECPAGNEVLHRDGVVARAKPLALVERMRGLQRSAVDLDAKPGPVRHRDPAALDLQRLPGQGLAVLPDPVGVDRGDLARRRRADMGEHGERNIEVIVGMRAPGQAVVAAGLRHAHRALHGPEVRIGEGNVNRAEFQR